MINLNKIICRKLEKKIYELNSKDIGINAFELKLPGESCQKFGSGKPVFSIKLNKNGRAALLSMNELRIAEAYMNCDIDFEGEFLEIFKFREVLQDRHRLFYFWNVALQPILFGQIRSDRRWISQHYDCDQEFYALFLDKRTRCYSHGLFKNQTEMLEDAMERKLDFALKSCKIKEGDRVLDIGGGWGSFVEYAGKKGICVTSITISKESEDFINQIINKNRLPCQVQNQHFFDHTATRPYDAIVNLGVTEHLPDYKQTIQKYVNLLKPSGRVYIDASAAKRKYKFSSFINKYIYPGNPSPLSLHDFCRELTQSPLELIAVINDNNNYYLTAKQWALNLDSSKDIIIKKWGEGLYRMFRLYLWGTVHVFESGMMDAYRMILELPIRKERYTRWRRNYFK